MSNPQIGDPNAVHKSSDKKKVSIDAEHVDITSAETTDKVAADKALAAEVAADKVKAAAEVAANVKLEADRVAAEVKANDARVAQQVRLAELTAAAEARRLDFWQKVALPVIVALISGAVVCIPGSITAWNQAVELREIKQTGKETHELVNSASLAQLKLNADLSHWKADQTKNPEDIRAAEAADKLVAEHIEKQKKANATKRE